MSTSTSACYDFAACSPRKSSRKATPYTVFGHTAVASLVLGCVWTVYANVLGASIYPAVTANFNSAVTKPLAASVALKTPAANTTQTARFEPAPVASSLETVASVAPFTFDDRFAASARSGVDASKPPEVSPPPPSAVQLVETVPLPVARPSTLRLLASREIAKAKAAILSVASAEKPSIFDKLYGKPHAAGPMLAYASADFGDVSIPGPAKINAMGAAAPYDRSTAVYDISARTVYLPDGSKLEAHSGLGARLDDPRYVHVKMHGATPPHVYDLEPREALFHGVAALRLKPVGGEQAIFGRTGLLAHTYMLGPNGDSNGCVSFKDYDAFLRAYRNGGIKRLAVVAKVE